MTKDTITITFPNKMLCNSYGYDFFARIAGETIVTTNTFMTLDFSNCTWFDGNLCAVLGNILEGLLERGNSMVFVGLSVNIEKTFTRNKFLKRFAHESIDPLDALTIPYTSFQLQDEQRATDYIKEQLFDKSNMPQMSEDAKKSVLVSIFEVIVNAITHGGCRFVNCCGQIFPARNPPEVSISFVDLGRTIKANVNEYLIDNKSGNETILWALEEGNTTKSGNEPGGIGLKLLQNLINLNKGSLQIVSADGFVELRNGVYREHFMKDYFPGTIVTIKLLLGDSNFYILSSEVDTDNIF